ncbi:hypothetical protein AAVH_39929 [Aphelenchoides avenae]|nr:hypothetical protein AAVH_39929 [Aphelenchus avenae]
MASFEVLVIFTALSLISCANALSCYSCQFSYNDIYDIDDGWCANETLLLMSPDDVIRPCAPWETYCMTAVTTALNSFLSVSRSCAARCSTLCESDEYGINQVSRLESLS